MSNSDLILSRSSDSDFAPLFTLRNVSKFLEVAGLLTFAADHELMTLSQAAEYRGVSLVCLAEMAKRGTLPSSPIFGRNKRRAIVVLVRKSDIDALPPVKDKRARKFRKERELAALQAKQAAQVDTPASIPSQVDAMSIEELEAIPSVS